MTLPGAVRLGTVVGMAIAIGELHAAGVVLDLAAIAVIVVYAAKRHPVIDCYRCKGRRSVRSWYMPWAKGPCPRCGGSGNRRRVSSRVFAPTIARKIRAKSENPVNRF